MEAVIPTEIGLPIKHTTLVDANTHLALIEFALDLTNKRWDEMTIKCLLTTSGSWYNTTEGFGVENFILGISYSSMFSKIQKSREMANLALTGKDPTE